MMTADNRQDLGTRTIEAIKAPTLQTGPPQVRDPPVAEMDSAGIQRSTYQRPAVAKIPTASTAGAHHHNIWIKLVVLDRPVELAVPCSKAFTHSRGKPHPMTGPSKAERIAEVVGCVIGIVGVLIFAVWSRSLFSFGKEHYFAILSLGGAAGIHPGRQGELEQMIALAIEIVAIIDSERGSASDKPSAQRLGFVSMCGRLNIKCYMLDRRATENYLTQRAIDQALGPGRFRALQPFESLSSVQAPWSKKENWKIAHELSRSEVESTDLA
jgi:hypothetical protein